jgi:hypothetical protein
MLCLSKNTISSIGIIHFSFVTEKKRLLVSQETFSLLFPTGLSGNYHLSCSCKLACLDGVEVHT